MFKRKLDVEFRKVNEGIQLSTLVYGEKTSLVEFRLKAGSVVPSHQHPYEQTGYLVSGAIKFTIEDKTFMAMPGDSWCVLENVPHSAEVLEDSVIIETFSPPRKEYM